MAQICITDGAENVKGLHYIKNSVAEITAKTGSVATLTLSDKRCRLAFDCPDYYADILQAEVADKIAEVIAVGYKYGYFKSALKMAGLSDTDREILFSGLIAADLSDDKKYAFERVKNIKEAAIDGVFNFRLRPLKKKWRDIADYMPTYFLNSQLKDFITFLLENRKTRTYIDGCRVYDNYYRRLKRCALTGGEDCEIVREVILSNCGEVEIRGSVPPLDEKYLKEFYGEKVYFAARETI